MTTIARTYYFESAHRLPLLPETHKCHHLHGHNYKMTVMVRGNLDERGFVMDFAEMDTQILPLIKQVDHKVLNDVQGLENPTAELIAQWFLQRIETGESIRIYENEDCYAEISKADKK